MKKKERKLREEIRKQLEKEARARIEKSLSEQKSVAENKSIKKSTDLSDAVKEYLRLLTGFRFYKKYDDFLICLNHLDEVEFMTPNQVEEQHEFYNSGKEGEKLVQKMLQKKPKANLESNSAKAYVAELTEKFNKSYDEWLKVQKIQLEKKIELEEVREKEKIIEEEREKFYRSHPEYKKYINHLGEMKWMTEAEFREQNEFFPMDEGIIARIRENPAPWFFYFVIFVLTALAITVYFWPQPKKYAYLKISSNEGSFRVLAERSNYLVKEKNKLLRLPLQDSIRVKVRVYKPGFRQLQGDTVLNLIPGDTTRYQVRLEKIDAVEDLAKVIINANVSDAKIFINRSFYGNYPDKDTIFLDPGTYEIQVFKDGYRNLTGTREVTLKSNNETRKLDFNLEAIASLLALQARKISGSISVSSSIPEADVFINGEYSGKTNLVLDNMSSGKYKVEVRKKGYTVVPEYRVVQLGQGREVATVDFTLLSTSGQLRLDVNPGSAIINMDGRVFSTGSYNGLISVGKHVLEPQPLPNYRTPKPIHFSIKRNDYRKIAITYSPDIDYGAFLNQDGMVITEGGLSLIPGYERLGIFKEDRKLGPEIINDPNVGTVWKLGYALRYDSPPGKDGFIIVIRIPVEFDLSFPVYFSWEGYKLDENYPITPVENHSLDLIVNGKVVFNNYEPKKNIGDRGKENERFQINQYLRAGKNTIKFVVGDNNSSYYLLKGFRIH